MEASPQLQITVTRDAYGTRFNVPAAARVTSFLEHVIRSISTSDVGGNQFVALTEHDILAFCLASASTRSQAGGRLGVADEPFNIMTKRVPESDAIALLSALEHALQVVRSEDRESPTDWYDYRRRIDGWVAEGAVLSTSFGNLTTFEDSEAFDRVLERRNRRPPPARRSGGRRSSDAAAETPQPDAEGDGDAPVEHGPQELTYLKHWNPFQSPTNGWGDHMARAARLIQLLGPCQTFDARADRDGDLHDYALTLRSLILRYKTDAYAGDKSIGKEIPYFLEAVDLGGMMRTHTTDPRVFLQEIKTGLEVHQGGEEVARRDDGNHRRL